MNYEFSILNFKFKSAPTFEERKQNSKLKIASSLGH